jgi:redox-sensitive bicupin YhaK (pirin superfamily)
MKKSVPTSREVPMIVQDKNIVTRPSSDRGHSNQGWLNSRHSFSFANYYDPDHMGFRTLRVINEDIIQGASGFGAHAHSDMEIVSYVVSGGLEHTDSMGSKTIILPDEVQIMSAGKGVTHGEMNHLKNQETHFFQIWILPEKKGLRPGYGQKSFQHEFLENKLTLVVSRDKRNGSLEIHQDADIYIGRLKSRDEINFKIRAGRYLWVQLIKGSLQINKVNIKAGDGLSVSHENALSVCAGESSEFLLFDLN